MQERYKIQKIPASILNYSLLSSECNIAGKLQVQPNVHPEFFTGGGADAEAIYNLFYFNNYRRTRL